MFSSYGHRFGEYPSAAGVTGDKTQDSEQRNSSFIGLNAQQMQLANSAVILKTNLVPKVPARSDILRLYHHSVLGVGKVPKRGLGRQCEWCTVGRCRIGKHNIVCNTLRRAMLSDF